MSSNYFGSIAGEMADQGARDEAAFFEWLNEYTRHVATGTYHDDLRAAFDAGAGATRRADTFDGITGEDGLHWISCQPLLLEAMQFMGLPGYRTCGEAPRRPGGMHTPDGMTSHYHGVPMAVASTWVQCYTEGRKPLGFKEA